MSDLSRERMIEWMRVTFSVAAMSKCERAHYGSIILNRNLQVVGIGRNGKPAGSVNDHECYRRGLLPNSPLAGKCCLHSEQSALMFSNRDDRLGGTFFVSGMPCEDCALLIMQSGVSTLVCMGDDQRGYPGLETIERYQGTIDPLQVALLPGKLKVQVVTLALEEVFPEGAPSWIALNTVPKR